MSKLCFVSILNPTIYNNVQKLYIVKNIKASNKCPIKQENIETKHEFQTKIQTVNRKLQNVLGNKTVVMTKTG